MSYFAKIIYFSDKSRADKVVSSLSSQKIETKSIPIKRRRKIDDLSDYSAFKRESAGTLEKNYLRDDKKRQALVLAIQKAALNDALSDCGENDVFFIEDNFSPESFYLKKELFKLRKRFFTFGNLYFDDSLFIVEGALDIGFHEASFLSKNFIKIYDAGYRLPLSFPQFNKLLAVDFPPDSIPLKYLRHFRSPLQITKNIIKLFDSFSDKQRRPPLFLLNQPQDSELFSSRQIQLKNFLGRRAVLTDSFQNLPPETTILTWSTRRFFSYLKAGFRPVAAAKSLIAFAFKKSTLKELILEAPDELKMVRIGNFLELSKLQNFKLK